MGTTASDEQIVQRMRRGKVGAMPAFDGQFDDAKLVAIVAYIRALQPPP